ncbi:MAG: shikimate dehydrogenase [Thomasclavelia sp.]|jgi:shikimate dehydrogenase|nr:shikimate dehydrogenase [Thomasclavelia sp.]
MNKIDAHTTLYTFLGSPASHSKSPAMHNLAFNKLGLNSVYLAFDVNKDTLEDTINTFKKLKVQGSNISMPCKEAIIPLLDSITTRAKLAGAVNTIKLNSNGGYDGDLTDGVGFTKTLTDKGWNIKDQDIVCLGAGGASKAIIVELALLKAKSIKVFNRSDKKEYKEFLNNVSKETGCKITFNTLDNNELLSKSVNEAYLLINTSGVGMEPLEGQSLIKDVSCLKPDLKVADIIYQPEATKLLLDAKSKGCDTVNGKLMLLYQGAESFKIWTGKEMPVEDVKKEIGIEE